MRIYKVLKMVQFVGPPRTNHFIVITCIHMELIGYIIIGELHMQVT